MSEEPPNLERYDDYIPPPQEMRDRSSEQDRLITDILTNVHNYEQLRKGIQAAHLLEGELARYAQDKSNLRALVDLWHEDSLRYAFALGVVGSFLDKVPDDFVRELNIKNWRGKEMRVIRDELLPGRQPQEYFLADRRLLISLIDGMFVSTPDGAMVTFFYGDNMTYATEFVQSDTGLIVPGNYYFNSGFGIRSLARESLQQGQRIADSGKASTLLFVGSADPAVDNVIRSIDRDSNTSRDTLNRIVEINDLKPSLIELVHQVRPIQEGGLRGLAKSVIRKFSSSEIQEPLQPIISSSRKMSSSQLTIPVYLQRYGRVSH